MPCCSGLKYVGRVAFGEYGIQCILRSKSGDIRYRELGDNSFPDGVEDDFGGAVKVQLLHDPGPMSLNRIGTEVQHAGDFLVRFAFG